MKKEKSIRKIIADIWWFGGAVLLWLVSFVTDPGIFTINSDNRMFYYLVKGIYFFVLCLVWRFLREILRALKRKDPVVIERTIYALVYATLLVALLVLTWPGIWRTDEFGILGNVVVLQLYWWQHFLTSIFYMLSFMLFPFPSGVILVQIILVSAGFGYLAQTLRQKMELGRTGILLFIPFCIPSVLLFQLYPMRITLYAIVEIVLLTFLYTKQEQGTTISVRQIIWLALGTVLLANWRTEGSYYVVLLPVVLWFYRKDRKEYKKYILYLVMAITGTLAVWIIQSTGLHKDRNDAYEITAYAQSIVPLINQAYLNGDTEGLTVADKVISVDEILRASGEGMDGITCFWNGYMTSKEYTGAQFDEFKKQYFKWIQEYPLVYLRERTENFLTSNEQTNPTDDLSDESNIQFVYFLTTFSDTTPLFPVLRGKLIRFMEQKIWCSNVIPIVALSVATFWGLGKKRKSALLLLLILVRVPLVFLTAPDNYFMYYYPMFLSGNMVILCGVIRMTQNLREYRKLRLA